MRREWMQTGTVERYECEKDHEQPVQNNDPSEKMAGGMYGGLTPAEEETDLNDPWDILSFHSSISSVQASQTCQNT